MDRRRENDKKEIIVNVQSTKLCCVIVPVRLSGGLGPADIPAGVHQQKTAVPPGHGRLIAYCVSASSNLLSLLLPGVISTV